MTQKEYKKKNVKKRLYVDKSGRYYYKHGNKKIIAKDILNVPK